MRLVPGARGTTDSDQTFQSRFFKAAQILKQKNRREGGCDTNIDSTTEQIISIKAAQILTQKNRCEGEVTQTLHYGAAVMGIWK